MQSARTTRTFLYAFCAISLVLLSAQVQPDPHFLMVKLGDETATQERASDFLAQMGAYLTDQVPSLRGNPLHGLIANREVPAVEALRENDVILGFVPPGFYFAHLHGLDRTATPVAQIPRFGASVDRYYLVVPKNGPRTLEGLEDAVVSTTFAVDEAYLRRVVFPADFQPGEHFRMKPSENMSDAVFFLIEGEPGDRERTPAAVLLDEELKRFFEEDDLVWPELRILWTSPPLPRDLVVAIGPSWTDAAIETLRAALFQMSGTPRGAELLDLMNSSGFAPVDTTLLRTAQEKYFSSP